MRSIAIELIDRINPRMSVNLRVKRQFHPGSLSEVATLVNYLSSRGISAADTAFDIGANSGLFSLPLSSMFAEVVSVEPNIERARFLQRALPENVRVVCAACGSGNSVAVMTVPKRKDGIQLHGLGSIAKRGDAALFHTGGEPVELTEFTVPVVTVDALAKLAKGKISFLKIDVEGHEDAVLAGSETVLRDHRPILFIEIETRHGVDGVKIFEELRSLGYRCMSVNLGKLEALNTPESFAAALATPEIINFLFEPERT